MPTNYPPLKANACHPVINNTSSLHMETPLIDAIAASNTVYLVWENKPRRQAPRPLYRDIEKMSQYIIDARMAKTFLRRMGKPRHGT